MQREEAKQRVFTAIRRSGVDVCDEDTTFAQLGWNTDQVNQLCNEPTIDFPAGTLLPETIRSCIDTLVHLRTPPPSSTPWTGSSNPHDGEPSLP